MVRSKLICAAALCVAAASSEMGAALAIGFALCMLLRIAHRRLFRKELPDGLGAGAWWIVPAGLGVVILTTVTVVRVHLDEASSRAQPHTGQFFYALDAGIKGFGMDLTTFNEAANWPAVLVSLGSRAMLAFGVAGLLREYMQGGSFINRRHLALAGALAIAAFFSIAAAYHDYGTLCCERQSTTRGGFIDMIFVIGAGILLGRGRWQPGWPAGIWIAAALLAVSLSPIALVIPRIRTEYTLLNWAETGRDRSWVSGTAPHTAAMQFFLPPDSPQALIRGTGIAVGTYKLDPGRNPHPEQLVAVIGRYFGKQIVFVCQPWQTNKAWFINNKWISACPSPARLEVARGNGMRQPLFHVPILL